MKIFLISIAESYQMGFQMAASPYMHGIINLHHHIMFYLVMVLCFTFTMLYFTLKTFTINYKNHFKKYSQIKLLYNIRFNHHALLDVIWTVIPTIILILIALPSFALLYSFDYCVKAPHTTLEVIGHQWYWSYEYNTIIKDFTTQINYTQSFQFDSYMVPTEDLKVGQLRLLSTTSPVILPTGQFIKCLITAEDVLHSWAIPSLGVKMDAMPGRSSIVYIYIETPGIYYGQCSELCGVNHGFMPIEVHGVHSYEYDFWIYLKSQSLDSSNLTERQMEQQMETIFLFYILSSPNYDFYTRQDFVDLYGKSAYKEFFILWKQTIFLMEDPTNFIFEAENINWVNPVFDNKFHYDFQNNNNKH